MGISVASLPRKYQDQAAVGLYGRNVFDRALASPRVKPKGTPQHRESSAQQAVIRWFKVAHRTFGVPDARLLTAIPNGGFRRAGEAARLVGEGVRAGMPDLMLFVARGAFHGLGIEMKDEERGTVSASQREVRELLISQGYPVVIAYGSDEAVKAIEAYLRQPRILSQ